MRLIHQHPEHGSTSKPELTFIKHYVLTRMACQVMAAALAEEGEHLLEDPDLQQDDEEESNQADDSDDEAVDGPPEDQANVQETLAELDEPAADEPDNELANMHRGHDA